MTKKVSLSASMEDYLETIWLLERRVAVVRVRDIAKARAVALPSVNNALKNLSKSHLVKHDRYEFVELTSRGNLAAQKIHGRHLILSRFLQEVLGVDKKTAEEDACKIEHSFSPESLERLIKFMDSVQSWPPEMKFAAGKSKIPPKHTRGQPSKKRRNKKKPIPGEEE